LACPGRSAKMAARNIVNFVTNCAPKRLRSPFSRHQIALQNVSERRPKTPLCRPQWLPRCLSETPAVAA
jgi:hypothetical protein